MERDYSRTTNIVLISSEKYIIPSEGTTLKAEALMKTALVIVYPRLPSPNVDF